MAASVSIKHVIIAKFLSKSYLQSFLKLTHLMPLNCFSSPWKSYWLISGNLWDEIV